MNTPGSFGGQNDQEIEQSQPIRQEKDPKLSAQRGAHIIELVYDLENPENTKELKALFGNRSHDEFLGILKDISVVCRDLRDRYDLVKAKYQILKTSVEAQGLSTEKKPAKSEPEPEPEPKKKKVKMPDPPIFQNDGNPTWEDWRIDMQVKLRSENTWDENDKMGYILSRTGKNVRALIQTGYVDDEYSTSQEMLNVMANAYDDPHKKTKARTSYRNLRMGESERFDTFMSKFTTYAAQAGITDNTMKREDLYDKVTRPLRDAIRPCLSIYPTFIDLREQLSLLFWELEAEKKRTPPRTAPSKNTPSRTTTNTTTKEEKARPTYTDKRKADLSAKGACFICEQTGHMAKDCPKNNTIKALEENEDSEKEDP
jgi:hypothetical protein